MVQKGWSDLAAKNGLHIHVTSIYPLSHFEFEYPNALVIKTLFTQEMLKKGYLATNAFYTSFAHTEKDVLGYLDTVDTVFAYLADAVRKNNAESLLEGPVCQTGFQRLS